jgi:hypothetical protein
MKRFYNQNHSVQRKVDGFNKIASVYDQQGISNRGAEGKELSFSSLTPSESEAVLGVMKKEASELDALPIEKKANVVGSPFEIFGQAKNYIQSKLGITDEVAHDLTSSVVARAQDLQQATGGQLGDMVTGIVDQMNPQDVQQRIGAVPMRNMSPNELEELIKERLIEQLQMSAYQADSYKKIVIQQAKNLLVQYRTHNLTQISLAIVAVLVEHQDPSVVYGISTNERLRKEIEFKLTQA